MLVDKDELQVGHQLFQYIQDIDHLQVPVHQVVRSAGQRCIQQVGQPFRQHLDVDKRPGLLAIALDGDKLVEVGFEDEFVDHGIEAHALAVPVNIPAAHNVGVDLGGKSPYMFFAAKLGDGVQCLRIGGCKLI